MCGSVDVTGVLIGWEGSELAVKLLTDLCRKLWCMLSLQVRLDDGIVGVVPVIWLTDGRLVALVTAATAQRCISAHGICQVDVT